MRVKIEKAEEQIPKPSPERSLEQLLTQDDALRLAKETALRSREVGNQDMQELYEKVVLDEISIPEYLYFISNSIKSEAYSNVIKAMVLEEFPSPRSASFLAAALQKHLLYA